MSVYESALLHLPSVLLLDVCYFLDVKSLVSLSQVNSSLRNLSRDYKSFWLPSVQRERLVLPLPPNRALDSFTAPEIHIAAHRAIFRETNLSQPEPQILSYTQIDWPPLRSPDLQEEGVEELDSDDFCWRIKVSPDGNWLFLMSKHGIMRIVHLRTKTIMFQRRFLESIPDTGSSPPICIRTHFLENDVVLVAVAVMERRRSSTSVQETGDIEERHMLHIIQLHLDPTKVRSEDLKSIPIADLPRHLDVAGDYVVYAPKSAPGTPQGPIRLLNWQIGIEVVLPPLLECVYLRIYEEYFFSIGVQEPDSGILILQVVALPSSRNKHCLLATSISLPPPGFPNDIRLSISPPDICHRYMGRSVNTIEIWAVNKPPFPCTHVFTLHVDFGKTPKEWFRDTTLPTSEDSSTLPERRLEHRIVWDTRNSDGVVEPATEGRRFVWWEVTWIEDAWSRENAEREIKLYLSTIEGLRCVKATDKFPSAETDHWEERWDYQLEQSRAYPAHYIDRLVLPGNGYPPMVRFEEWSGTLVTVGGDIWVMRFGHR